MGDIVTNPRDELDGLLAAISGAVDGAITRPVTVLHRDYDGFYPGPWPLILLRLSDFNLRRISGGTTGRKGQEGAAQNYYAVEVQDVIDPRAPTGNRVADSQDDLYALIGAILDWFDHLPNQALPVDGVATCYRAGEYIRFRMARPFQSEDGGDVRLVVAGLISVLGLTRPGQVT